MPQFKPFPPAGLYSLSVLPEPYQTAFRLGSAHHLPGQFLPAQTDWFIQIFMLPFALLYASPLLVLGPGFVVRAIRQPGSYWRFWQTLMQQSLAEMGFTLLLFLLVGVLIAYCTCQAWDGLQSFYRTWQVSRMRRRREEGYGIVLLSHAIVGRLVDNLGWHNCLWLPRSAIANVVWQRIREEGAKQSRWVYRTHICYVTATGDRRWLTLKGGIVELGYPSGDERGDRALYEILLTWWKEPSSTLDDR